MKKTIGKKVSILKVRSNYQSFIPQYRIEKQLYLRNKGFSRSQFNLN